MVWFCFLLFASPALAESRCSEIYERDCKGVLQSPLRLLGLLQVTADRGSMDTQIIPNLGQPIPLLPIGPVDEPRRRSFPLKQDAPGSA